MLEYLPITLLYVSIYPLPYLHTVSFPIINESLLSRLARARDVRGCVGCLYFLYVLACCVWVLGASSSRRVFFSEENKQENTLVTRRKYLVTNLSPRTVYGSFVVSARVSNEDERESREYTDCRILRDQLPSHTRPNNSRRRIFRACVAAGSQERESSLPGKREHVEISRVYSAWFLPLVCSSCENETSGFVDLVILPLSVTSATSNS